jgi:hypothetical protein
VAECILFQRICARQLTGDFAVPEETFQSIGERLVGQIDEERRKTALDRLGKMIEYAIKRQDWYEDQRNKALSVGVTLLGLASFLVGGLLSATVEPMVYFRVFASFTLASVAVTSASIILEYAFGGSEAYTHRGLADIRSWFFAYIVKEPVAKAAVLDLDQADHNRDVILEAWGQFVTGWVEYEQRPKGFIIEDLQQVFILYLF